MNEGRIAFLTGSAALSIQPHCTKPSRAFSKRMLASVAATWDGKKKRIFIDGKQAVDFPFIGECVPDKRRFG